MDIANYILFWELSLTIFLFGSGILLFYISVQGFKVKNVYGGLSTIVSAIILLLFSVYNIIYGIFPYPYNGFFTFWVVPLFILFGIYGLVIKKKETSRKISINTSNTRKIENIDRFKRIDSFSDENIYKKNITIKEEYFRKSFHLAGILIIASYFGIGFEPVTSLINNTVIKYINTSGTDDYIRLWGDLLLYPFTLNDPSVMGELTIFALFATYAFICFPEYIRILAGPQYSFFNRVTGTVLRGKEYKSAGPQIFLVLGVITSFFFAKLGFCAYEYAIAASLISCFSDAIAAIIGRTYGKHKVKVLSGDKKSLEGFFAGFLSAFFIALIFIDPIHALIAAFTFLLIDYLSLPIADNLLNPIGITIILLCII